LPLWRKHPAQSAVCSVRKPRCPVASRLSQGMAEQHQILPGWKHFTSFHRGLLSTCYLCPPRPYLSLQMPGLGEYSGNRLIVRRAVLTTVSHDQGSVALSQNLMVPMRTQTHSSTSTLSIGLAKIVFYLSLSSAIAGRRRNSLNMQSVGTSAMVNVGLEKKIISCLIMPWG